MRSLETKARSCPQRERTDQKHQPTLRAIRHGVAQPKLKIGAVNDPAEHEADRIADNVMRMSDPTGDYGRTLPRVNNTPAQQQRESISPDKAAATNLVRRTCAACQVQEQDRDTIRRSCAVCGSTEQTLRNKDELVSGKISGESKLADAAILSLGAGRPLPRSERAFFEPRFRTDLSSIRLHVGARADEASRAINARAFAIGENIAFSNGEYRPGTTQGRRLLAHEIAHVGQRSSGQIRRQPELINGIPGLYVPQLAPINEPAEPTCPRVPTGLGNLTPMPPCRHDGTDIEGQNFRFCSDSDVFADQADRGRLRSWAGRQRTGSSFHVRAYASIGGPGDDLNATAYNNRLACHRGKRILRELINAGVPERLVDMVARGQTERFGVGQSNQAANRVAVVDAENSQQTPVSGAADAAGVRDAAKAALESGNYNLAADAYVNRWTCGRYRTLADAVRTTTVQIEGVDFQNTRQRSVSVPGHVDYLGTNVIRLNSNVTSATDPIGCAMSRIADLTMHHVVRPQITNDSVQHETGRHLAHLAGLPDCLIDFAPLQADRRATFRPRSTDPFSDRAPICADALQPGAIRPGAGPAQQDPSPTFTAPAIRLGTSSGSVIPSRYYPGANTIGAEPALPFILGANVNATGDVTELARWKIGFVQTVLSETWVNTHVDGQREVRKLPLPMRDGPARGAAQSDPPWYAQVSRVQAVSGQNRVAMADVPQMRAFKVLPSLSNSRFFDPLNVPANNVGDPGITHHRPTIGLRPTHNENAPDTGERELALNTWIVARRDGAGANRAETVFIRGMQLTFRLDVNWQPTNSRRIEGRGQWSLRARNADPSESSTILLDGASPNDFTALSNVPLYNEFQRTEDPLPVDRANGYNSVNDYSRAVRQAVAPFRDTPRLREGFELELRIQLETGRLILTSRDPEIERRNPTMDRENITVQRPVRLLPGSGDPISIGDREAFISRAQPHLQQIVAGRFLQTQRRVGRIAIPIHIPALRR